MRTKNERARALALASAGWNATARWAAVLAATLATALAPAAFADDRDHDRGRDNNRDGDAQQRHRNDSGTDLTISATGPINKRGPFFTSLGSNGRSCVSCHQPNEGWSVTPQGMRERFEASRGLDPIFRLNDGAVSPHRRRVVAGARARKPTACC